MGTTSSCSKCFKKKSKIEKPIINPIMEDKTEQPMKCLNSSIRENITFNINPVKQKNKQQEIELKENHEEEVKNTNNNINFDDYFSREQLIYYNKLYETEIYDREPIKPIQKYKKGEVIGEGAYAKVYKAFDEDEGKVFAVKELDLNKLNTKHLLSNETIENEVDVLSKLLHKNIVKYYGMTKTDIHLDILLEYCVGGSISKLIRTFNKFPENIIKKYTTQILEGLEYLHAHNFIHRDIKGANILVDTNGVCKLSDFGGAKILVNNIDITKKSFKGTPNWMAPEVVKNDPITRYSDIWSIGCTVIEMATGQPPWNDYEDGFGVLYALYNSKVPPSIPNDLSKELQDFLKCCLKINPSERYNVYQLLRHPFITGDYQNETQAKARTEYEIKKFHSDNRIFDTGFNSKDNANILNKRDIISTNQIDIVEII